MGRRLGRRLRRLRVLRLLGQTESRRAKACRRAGHGWARRGWIHLITGRQVVESPRWRRQNAHGLGLEITLGGVLRVAGRGRLVQLRGNACDGRQLGRVGRYGGARGVACILREARRREVLCGMRGRRGRWKGGGRTGDGLWRGQARGIAFCVARPEVGEDVGGRHAEAGSPRGCSRVGWARLQGTRGWPSMLAAEWVWCLSARPCAREHHDRAWRGPPVGCLDSQTAIGKLVDAVPTWHQLGTQAARTGRCCVGGVLLRVVAGDVETRGASAVVLL